MPSEFDYKDVVGNRSYRPFTTYLPADLQERLYGRGGSLPSTTIRTGKSFDPLSEKIDAEWAGKTSDGEKFNTYYDYYFTGEDIRVYIDGLFDPEYELDLAGISFAIRQEKQPLYGFWSYTYDAVMSGVRIISGQFAMYSRYPGRMRELLSVAAEQRVLFNNGDKSARIQSYLSGRDEQSIEDEKNIRKYWNRSNLDRLSADSDGSDQRNIFSAHPPFNLIIKYGTQEGSVSTIARNKGTNSEDNFDTLDRLMATDFNERLVKPGKVAVEMDIVLQDVNLTSLGVSITPGGMAVVENYDFMARDMYISNGNLRSTDKSILSDVESNGTKQTDPAKVQPVLTPEELRLLNQRTR